MNDQINDPSRLLSSPGPKPLGRPTIFTKELADNICVQLALGNSLRKVCKSDDMPAMSTIFYWLRDNKAFLEQYTRAKEESADALYEETQDIADESLEDARSADPKSSNAIVQAYKLRVDTRKWMMSKMKPKKYGEKLDLSTLGKELPQPLLYAIRDNNINKEDKQPE